ncbi:PucR family transcriptional regulator [Solicola sp. PLA-1-18]|uniref:PucR family transcriptional regulator n=1 Tax=Solicola sp. PLA-1-18 TaxID=3380532 RepID=UPI003B7CC91E
MEQVERERWAEVLEGSLGELTTSAIARMDATLPWYAALDAQHRSWIGAIAHGGISGMIDWLRSPAPSSDATTDPFGSAPRALARVVTLQQTVAMVRTTIDLVESKVEDLFDPADHDPIRLEIALYARELAFAAADVYARAAEARGAWDARLEALVVDSVLRGETDETISSRAAAVGWSARGAVAVVIGDAPTSTPTDGGTGGVVESVHRAARLAGLVALSSVQGDRLVVILGDVDDLDKAGTSVAGSFGPGPVVVGPRADDLRTAYRSARSATAAWRSASAWVGAPRPVQADELLVERSLAGDGHARRALAQDVYLPLTRGDAPLVDTVRTFFDSGASIEGTARALYVHPNTVRYRLRKVAEVTGLRPTHPREGYTLRIALTLGRLLRPESADDADL